MTRRSWIGIHSDVTQKRQCVLASVVRGTVDVLVPGARLDRLMSILHQSLQPPEPFMTTDSSLPLSSGLSPAAFDYCLGSKRGECLVSQGFINISSLMTC
jgi:hypothetical protein